MFPREKGVVNTKGRRMSKPGREKVKEPSSWKEESEKKGKHGKREMELENETGFMMVAR